MYTTAFFTLVVGALLGPGGCRDEVFGAYIRREAPAMPNRHSVEAF